MADVEESKEVKHGSIDKEDELTQDEYQLKKRLPRKLPRRPNDVYVNKKSNFKAQLVCCERLFEKGYTEIFIHGMGAASPRAINLALQLNINHRNTLSVATNTSTQRVVDDLVALDEQRPARAQTRSVSAIHIRLAKTVLA
ncbi:ribonuclease P protein subunit p20-like isoform X1 [Amphibalanus amphitrite]|uniref:ribonuclease P protein subunit p20-like isoform X1 n=1 Tax=Amphibalanus amphitrite TaxID=1232801 RepID=UPI001C917C1C|nr:ribonuclease P protein subunit p20-like isoform X1 [Amphibalanus amphitrite]XP_043240645.1 ribonuclease P protein subunit p20-like isoform X1 [Amphibalanus amphitrite]XP_043240656.1 ribonuclease P protein subunit p20-like isoform X1 [Amphibalanus amphitrite]XP_043240665.1 ribonuclease P protein subunit p20-like isoform X1 [Amphibalanus amphitrite]XP_043240675.1 ribonuclease P protein subunit p20-like isoform X1 [Amphibalanus amphitrite]XP_043240684.1 ribonuclease P protein subunit p20-like 